MVEEARLESVYTPKAYHGFESRSLRNIRSLLIFYFVVCQQETVLKLYLRQSFLCLYRNSKRGIALQNI